MAAKKLFLSSGHQKFSRASIQVEEAALVFFKQSILHNEVKSLRSWTRAIQILAYKTS